MQCIHARIAEMVRAAKPGNGTVRSFITIDLTRGRPGFDEVRRLLIGLGAIPVAAHRERAAGDRRH